MKINIISPINQLGYGIAGLNVVKEFSKVADVALWPIGEIQCSNLDDLEICKNAANNMNKSGFEDAPVLKVWHQHDMRIPEALTGKTFGFPIFELDTFTDQEVNELNSVDHLIVCSRWAKGIVEQNGITVPVSVAPLGVDLDIFVPTKADQDRSKTIFFNCGKWEVRKGHDILIKAWDMLDQDNIELWMMCQNPFNSTSEENYWRNLYDRPNVKLIPRVNTQIDVYNIMAEVDCGVFPSRAEGWNLELLELMACGKHVITTEYSAHTEFCTKENSSLIPIDQLETAFDDKWFYGQGSWASIKQPQINQLSELMSEFHIKNSSSDQPLVNTFGIETSEKFTWSNTIKEIIKDV